jgi:hypothetical protein
VNLFLADAGFAGQALDRQALDREELVFQVLIDLALPANASLTTG